MPLTPRLAVADDIPELLRLRGVMFDAMDRREDDGAWQESSATLLREGFARGDVAAFVVDHPDTPGRVVSGGVAVIVQRLGNARNPSGRYGHVQSMATDPEFRRQGLARAVLAALLAWFEQRDIVAVDLHASPMGEPLYRSMGFREGHEPELRWRRPG